MSIYQPKCGLALSFLTGFSSEACSPVTLGTKLLTSHPDILRLPPTPAPSKRLGVQ